MFGRQYPIWNKVTACIYKSSKSYGVKNTGEVEVRVGTSRTNSHHFVTHVTTVRNHSNGDKEFRFYLNRQLLKCAILPKDKYELEFREVKSIQDNYI